nr:phosphatase PAP2 family protein [Chloroflexaceae bacterium]
MLEVRGTRFAVLLMACMLSSCSSWFATAPAAPGSQPAITGANTVPTTVAAPVQVPQLLSGLQVQVAPPPELGAPQLVADMAELRALQRNLTAKQEASAAMWESQATLRWNQIARELVSKHLRDPLTASRLYALLSVAQHDALQTALAYQAYYNRTMPPTSESGIKTLFVSSTPAAYPSEHAAMSGAAAAVLRKFFPQETAYIEQQRNEHQDSRLWAGVNCRTDLVAGDTLGRELAEALIARSDADLGAAPTTRLIPTGPDKWIKSRENYNAPHMTQWGHLKPWLMERPDQFRSPPPPAFGSAKFRAALEEVRSISDNRTEAQITIAKYWNDGAGTATPSGHWNQIAVNMLVEKNLGLVETTRVLAYLNMALMDAGISSWDTKYTYWLLRPVHADPDIKLLIALPNHPSYTSGHATFSGAAATFLGGVFPEQAAGLWAKAEEASRSRVYAGIHYRFDG